MASNSATYSALPRIPASIMTDDAATDASFHGARLRGESSRWLRFSWQTNALPSKQAASSGSDLIRPATCEEEEEVLQVILLSLSMDSAWNDSFAIAGEYIKTAVARLFNSDNPLCLVIPKGNRLIAASLLDPQEEAFNNLISGPSVLMEYRNRGIGAMLLHASLTALAERGLSSVAGITRNKSVAAQHVYSKFGSVSEPIALSTKIEIAKEAKD